jgi:hypothetical protein
MKFSDLLTLHRTRIYPAFRFPLTGEAQRGVDIGRVLDAKGVACHLDLGQVVVSPRLISYPFRPHSPHLIDWRSLSGHQEAVEGVLSIGPVRIYAERGTIWVETPREDGAVITCWEHAPDAEGRIPIGIDGRGQISYMRLGVEDVPHLLLIGPTQAGKTTAAFNIAFQLIRLAERDPDALRMLAVVSDTRGWQELLGVRQWWGVVMHDEAPDVIGWLRREVKRREAQGQTRPAIVVFLDDYPAILEEFPGVSAQVDGMLKQARRAGVHLVINTQDITKAGSGNAGRLITDKLVFGQASAADASLSSGRRRSGAETLMGKGDMLLTTNRLPRPVRLTSLLATPADLARLPSGGWERPPWLEEAERREQGANRREQGEAATATPRNRPVFSGNTTPAPPVPPVLPVQDEKVEAVRALLQTEPPTPYSQIVEQVWNVSRGGSPRYITACQECISIIAKLTKGVQ